MREIFINKAKTVAVSGHRFLNKDFDKQLLKQVFIYLVNNGYDTFLIGMAVGFDSECFKILEDIRKEKNIKIIACIPCRCQAKNFNYKNKIEYERMINSADEKIILQENYDKYCMLKRNNFMVDNASALVTYIRKDTGGTAYTVNYAKKKEIPIYRI